MPGRIVTKPLWRAYIGGNEHIHVAADTIDEALKLAQKWAHQKYSARQLKHNITSVARTQDDVIVGNVIVTKE